MEIYADKVLKLKSAYHCTYRQISNVNFTTEVVSLSSCELLLAVLVYMQKQQKCSHKAWHIHIEIVSNACSKISFKDPQREKAPLNKTPVLSESMNMDIWVVGSSNQLFITGSYTETKLSKNKADTDKTAFFVIGPFCTSHSICLNIGFWEGSFVWICYAFNCSAFN